MIGVSDLQAALADKLIRAGLAVFITHPRSVAQIFDTLRLVAGLVSAQERAEAWILQCQAHHGQIAVVAGGGDVCPERAVMSLGRDRVLADVLEPARRAPDLIVGSWCGKQLSPDRHQPPHGLMTRVKRPGAGG